MDGDDKVELSLGLDLANTQVSQQQQRTLFNGESPLETAVTKVVKAPIASPHEGVVASGTYFLTIKSWQRCQKISVFNEDIHRDDSNGD